MTSAALATPVPANSARITPTGVCVPLPDGREAYFNAYWLRDNCPTSFDRQTRERVFDIFHASAAPRAASAHVHDGALEVVWAGENHTSRYPLDWLASYAAPKPRHDPADLPRHAWYADHFADLGRFAFADLMNDPARVAAWLRALIVEGMAIVTDMPDNDDALVQLVAKMGHVRPTFFGQYFDVLTHAVPTNLAYTAKALELHTDTPAEDLAPGIQFLHCRANTTTGGESLFLDGVAVANDFRVSNPEQFRLLSETAIPFYCEHDDYDMRSRQTVIELDAHGEVAGLTISQHMADVFDLPQQFLDAYYPAFCAFGRLLQDPKYVMRFRMNAGECLVFDNHRVVHGRAAYDAASGARHLHGCYADRGEMRSRYRALVSESRFK
ncbi:TauD/TfdA family dioxygenase [Novosphingobium sp. FKTRR1]|uniref:TauD/TfdA family dioxygenase n=1 Tax=Novosphingobium sp. FKTRR1 TaxID=2879118 RepID=UPI001CF0D29E|nr:TauD/TfdA family dioxygenase [Novosphingobium sp. FKTRR1]